jgi:hypothetical protein
MICETTGDPSMRRKREIEQQTYAIFSSKREIKQ